MIEYFDDILQCCKLFEVGLNAVSNYTYKMPQKILTLICLLPMLLFAQNKREGNGWWNADRSPVGLAPKPDEESRAMVQIYSARAYSWRGYFAIHPWISFKEKNGKHFTTFEVMGFGGERGTPVIRTRHNEPDRRWLAVIRIFCWISEGKRQRK